MPTTDVTDVIRHQDQLIDTTSTKLGRAEGALGIIVAQIDGTWPAPTPGTGVTVELSVSLVGRLRELANQPDTKATMTHEPWCPLKDGHHGTCNDVVRPYGTPEGVRS